MVKKDKLRDGLKEETGAAILVILELPAEGALTRAGIVETEAQTPEDAPTPSSSGGKLPDLCGPQVLICKKFGPSIT